jgi:hypothetical protein
MELTDLIQWPNLNKKGIIMMTNINQITIITKSLNKKMKTSKMIKSMNLNINLEKSKSLDWHCLE